MNGSSSNPFGALQMDEGSSGAGPSTRQVEGEEVDTDVRATLSSHRVAKLRLVDTVAQARENQSRCERPCFRQGRPQRSTS